MRLARFLTGFGIALLCMGVAILLITYAPVIIDEASYTFFRPNMHVEVDVQAPKHPTAQVITPIDPNFGIIIPKIGANARIIPNVDPYNSYVYQVALTKGVAQALGSSVPGQAGNMFLFSHSSANFYDALRYNSIFYLLTKMETGDKVFIFYHKKKYSYTITGKQLVDPKDISFLTKNSNSQTLTLMTCWPPGTSLKRLLVFGTLSSVN